MAKTMAKSKRKLPRGGELYGTGDTGIIREKIRARMVTDGINIYQLSRKAGVPSTAANRFLKDGSESGILLQHAERMMKVLGIPAKW